MNSAIKTLLFVIVSLTWGTTWLAMKIAGTSIPPLFATGLRFLCAAPLLLLALKLSRSPLLFPQGQRTFQAMISLFYFAIPFTLMIYGERWVSSGLASVIFAMMPVAVLCASIVLLREKTNSVQLLGLTIALVALISVLLRESQGAASGQLLGSIMLVAAVVIHAVMYALCKKRCCSVSVLTFNALPCLIAGLLLTVVGWFTEHPVIADFSSHSLFAVVYLGAFAGVFGIMCYFMLQKRATAFQASIVFLIFPIIALSLENILYGRSLSFGSLCLICPLALGILLTLFGNQLNQRLKSKSQSAPLSSQLDVINRQHRT
ncbi:DMT family transporter [Rosenbergiella sp. S61]|uniref:DMT family transporter n=1 Tax=Rosenbergiella gaditana TaxID=2726987 RepID=A0ABS5SV36_9GAMM|nr:DMT family transporter [Rosenbergiella gaditana]MBT0723303.1 DMT family transporter [Rosenbergiella gaditana]